MISGITSTLPQTSVSPAATSQNACPATLPHFVFSVSKVTTKTVQEAVPNAPKTVPTASTAHTAHNATTHSISTLVPVPCVQSKGACPVTVPTTALTVSSQCGKMPEGAPSALLPALNVPPVPPHVWLVSLGTI